MDGNIVTNVRVKFKYDQLRIDRALGDFRKSDNMTNNKNDVRSAFGSFPGPKTTELRLRHLESHVSVTNSERSTSGVLCM